MNTATVRETTTPAAVGACFNGLVPPARISFAYRVGLVATACGMVILPLLYLAIVGAVGAVGVLWLRYGLFVFENIDGIYGLVAYSAPLFATFFCVCFLLKPLFAPARRTPPAVRIDLAAEPLLAEFIRGVTHAVGAPMPSVVQVDCAVNASASLGTGRRSFTGSDLTLTIGLPLVGGINTHEFAALLAHEFGHFSQRAGMTSSYLIRSINHWLARVVHERDAWDQELEEASRRGHWAGIIIAAATQVIVLFSRKLLGLLLNLGHAISCFQLRQMEFDADHYATQLAGTEAHLALTAALDPLGRAHSQAIDELHVLWTDRVLPKDFPSFVAERRISSAIACEEPPSPAKPSRWFNTHPTTEERNRLVVAANAHGRICTSGPAKSLFRDFAALSGDATEHFYTKEIGLDLKTVELISTEEVAYRIDAERNALREWENFAGPVLSLLRPCPLRDSFRQALAGGAPSSDRATLHQRVLDERPEVARLHEAWTKQRDSEAQATIAERLLAAGIGLAPGAFGLENGTPAEAASRRENCGRAARAIAESLKPRAENLRDYLSRTLACAANDSQHLRAKPIIDAAQALIEIEALTENIPELLLQWELAMLLDQQTGGVRHHPAFSSLALGAQRQLIAAFNALLANGKKARDPFRKNPPVGWTFADHLRNLLPQDAAPIETRANALLGGIAGVHRRLLASIHYHGLRLPPVLPQTTAPVAEPPLLTPAPAPR